MSKCRKNALSKSTYDAVRSDSSFISIDSNKMTTHKLLSKMRHKYTHFLIWGLALCVLSLFYVSLPPNTQSQQCNCESQTISINHNSHDIVEPPTIHPPHISNYKKNGHKLAILVPFRDRFEELMEFVPHIHNYLMLQNIDHHIYIMNQVDSLRFNRASLLNVGFLESPSECDYVSLHDVDLLPINPSLPYDYPHKGPFHVAAPHLHPRYHYPTFIGGILLITRQHYRAVDGLSNKYWGWGLEDDELYARFKDAHMDIYRPGNLSTGATNTFKHIHDRKVRKRDMIKCYNQQIITRRRDRHTGLSTTKYHVHSRKEMVIDGANLTVINVMLQCDRSITPWCNCTENVGNSVKSAHKSTIDVIVPKLDRKKHLSPHG